MSAAIVLAAVAIAGFVCAMIQNWRIVTACDEERQEMFRRGYRRGYIDAQLGRASQSTQALWEEEGGGHAAQ
jgi:hypothetical protein